MKITCSMIKRFLSNIKNYNEQNLQKTWISKYVVPKSEACSSEMWVSVVQHTFDSLPEVIAIPACRMKLVDFVLRLPDIDIVIFGATDDKLTVMTAKHRMSNDIAPL